MSSTLSYQNDPLEVVWNEMRQGKLISLLGAALFHLAIVIFLLSSWTSSMPKAAETKSLQIHMLQLPKPVPPVVMPAPQPKIVEPVKQLKKPAPKPVEKKEFAFKRVDKAKPKPKPKPDLKQPVKPIVKQPIESKPVTTEPVVVAKQQSHVQTNQAASVSKAKQGFDVTQYRPVEKQPPAYPRKALRKGIEGDCTVQYTVNTSGQVESPKVIGPCHPSFVKPSLEAAKTFRYAPRLVDGKAVAVPNVRNTFEYRIN